MTDQPTRSRTAPRGMNPNGELAAVVQDAQSRWGEEVAFQATALPGWRHIPFNVFLLDMALLGGVPESMVTQIYGWESAGKSMLCLRLTAGAQRKYPDKSVVFIDTEGTYDPLWAAKHGVDNSRVVVARPTTGENAVDLVDAVLRTEDTSMVVLDSIPSMVPFDEGDKSAEDAVVALRARLCGRMCSKINQAFLEERGRDHWPAMIMVNQFRYKIGVMMGDPRTLPGGSQVQYISGVKLEIKNKEVTGKDGNDVSIALANKHSFIVKKSKIGNSLRDGEFTLIRDGNHPLGEGAVDDTPTVVTYAKKFGLVHGGGSSWRVSVTDTTFRSMGTITDYLLRTPEANMQLRQQVIGAQRMAMGIPALPPDDYLLGPM